MKNIPVSLFVLLFLFIACNKNDDIEPLKIENKFLTGYVQKGPFNNGADITIYECDSKYQQTGKSYNTQIRNNFGHFELSGLSLISSYVEIKADGYYFNEITAKHSASPVILYAVTDIRDSSSINVNVLSTLERNRLLKLLKEGKSYDEAKEKVRDEILELFSFPGEGKRFEYLDISKEGNDNAILLATSAILQGTRTESELVQLIADISTDIEDNGVLDDQNLGSSLINSAAYLNTSQIRANLENKYAESGAGYEVPDFEKYISMFIENTNYELTSKYSYPEKSSEGNQNLLFPFDTTAITISNSVSYNSVSYSIAADLPKGGSLFITIEPLSALPNVGYLGVRTHPVGPVNFEYNNSNATKTFTSIDSGMRSEAIVSFIFGGKFVLKAYETNSQVPTIVREINVI